SEAGVLAFMVVRVTFTAATGPMPGTLRQLTGTGAWAMPTAMDRGEAATGRLMASTPTAIPTLATANTPTSTATDCTHTGVFWFARKSECGGKPFWRMHARRFSHLAPHLTVLGGAHRRRRLGMRRHLYPALPKSRSAHRKRSREEGSRLR